FNDNAAAAVAVATNDDDINIAACALLVADETQVVERDGLADVCHSGRETATTNTAHFNSTAVTGTNVSHRSRLSPRRRRHGFVLRQRAKVRDAAPRAGGPAQGQRRLLLAVFRRRFGHRANSVR
ncbi:unnamed protein product, partial [Ectocarpus sp. 12 AP-2014]